MSEDTHESGIYKAVGKDRTAFVHVFIPNEQKKEEIKPHPFFKDNSEVCSHCKLPADHPIHR